MRKYLNALLGFSILTIVMTYPLILKITSYIPGFFSTDEPFGAMWSFWRIKYSFLNNLSLKHTDLIAYPFGIDIFSSGFISYIWLGLTHLLSIITTPVLTWNIQIIINLFLTAIFTYYLVFFLTQSRLAGFLGGIVFSFSPAFFVRIWQHLGLTYWQWIPLILLSTILLRENSTRKRFVLLILSFLFLFSFDFSIMYLSLVSLFSFLVFSFLHHWRMKIKQSGLFKLDLVYLKKVIFAGIIAVIVLLPQFLPLIKDYLNPPKSPLGPSAFNPYHRPFEDLFTQSAKPLSYLLPAVVHPVFGKFTERFICSPLYGVSFTEHTLYLGWVPLGLAFIAFKRWKKNRKLRTMNYELRTKEDFYIGFFIFLAIVAWLFSQPPWWRIGPIRIFMPSFFMYKILPMYRAYCRFGIVVMLAIAVLAGFGLKYIIANRKSQIAKTATAILFCGLVLFEFWNWPPYKVIDVSKVPQVYYWLKDEPGDFAIAEYPLDADSPNEMYKFYQTKHEKKIINGTIPGTYANKVAQEIRKLSEPKTAGILKWMGVKYVVVHHEDYLNSELLEVREEFNKISENPFLRLVKTFPPQECPVKNIMCTAKSGRIDVYEVIALPREPDFAK